LRQWLASVSSAFGGDHTMSDKNAMRRTIPCLALCLLVQGCVGAGVLKKHTRMVADPEIPEHAYPALYPVDRSKATNTVVYTSEWLEAHWGKPVSVTHAGTDNLDEIWTYKFRSIWEGILPVVVIPIPIALPVEREKVRFVLHEGRVISATQSTRQTVGGAFGFVAGPCGAHFGPFSLEGFLE
jgi:hypothetical protein